MNTHSTAHALGGLRNGSGWLVHCPVPSHGKGRGDRSPSLSLYDGEGGRLLVHCFAGCDPRDVLAELRALGLLDGEPRASRVPLAPAKLANPANLDHAKEAYIRRLWGEGRPAAGTLVETYLRSRALTLAVPPSLRFHPHLKHTESGRWFPAMLAAVQDVDGRIVGLHRTFLARDGSGKADVEPAKKSFGPIAGGAVRLAPVAVVEPLGSECTGPVGLLVGEGIESVLSGMQAVSYPGWAALSTSGLKSLVLPPEARTITIATYGDDPGEEAAQAAARRWVREGRKVRIARPPKSMDFNDLLVREPKNSKKRGAV